MMDLYQISIDTILKYQSESGAYVACPNFPTYHYSWYRDGTFIAYAMNLAGEHASAGRFHSWATGVIERYAGRIEQAVEKARTGQIDPERDVLHTRFTLDGFESGAEAWENFQLDGFGTWLWGLGEHARLTGEALPEAWVKAACRVEDYLSALWRFPCYDCWEEFGDQVHLHTLAAIYGGLQSAQALTGRDHSAVLQEIAEFVNQNGQTPQGVFAKFVGSPLVDASLLGLATPYRLVSPDDPVMQATVRRIEQDLVRGGGVHRYTADTYYGGGEWVLLAAWLGWYYAEVGQVDRARQLLTWIETQSGPDGSLPEQVPQTLNDPSFYEPWVQRWGPIASPLLWSHAMYIVLRQSLGM